MCLVANIRHSKYTNYNSNSYKHSKKVINKKDTYPVHLTYSVIVRFKKYNQFGIYYAYHGAFGLLIKFRTDGRMVCYQKKKLIYHL